MNVITKEVHEHQQLTEYLDSYRAAVDNEFMDFVTGTEYMTYNPAKLNVKLLHGSAFAVLSVEK